MKDFFFILGFLGILILFSLSNGASLQNQASENSFLDTSDEESTHYPETVSAPSVSNDAREEHIAELYESLDSLKETAREVKLWENSSPYRGSFALDYGNNSDDPNYEYLTLTYVGDLGRDHGFLVRPAIVSRPFSQ